MQVNLAAIEQKGRHMAQESPVTEVFVGRDGALKQLRGRFNDLNEGRGRVVFITGEAGIGKTTVINYFLNELLLLAKSRGDPPKPSVLVLRASCRPTASGNPYGPFTELLEGLSEVGRERIIEKLRDWLPPLVEGFVPYLGPLLAKRLEQYLGIKGGRLGATASSQAHQFRELFEQLSKAYHLILFIDDLHWADEASLDVIFTLARSITEKNILLIGTYRPHEIVEKPGCPAHPLSKMLFGLQRHDLRYEIPLEQFVPDEIDSFLNRCYPNNKFPFSFRTMLYRETNGLPFFLDQEVRWLADEGHLFLDIDNRWSVKPLDTVPIPEGALGVVQDRVNKLDPDSRRLLTYASLFGEQFRSQVLAKILEKSHLSLLETLRGLATGYNMVRPIIDVAQSKLRPNWAFKHAFVQEVLYDLLLTEEKSELHRLAVDALESLFHDTLNELAGELAHHCEAAKRYDDAIKYRIAAAHRAYIAQSLTEHAAHCAQGIFDVEQLERSRVRLRDEVVLLSGQANVCRQLKTLDGEEKAAQRLLQLFEQYGSDPVAGIDGCLGLAHVAEQRRDKNSVIMYAEQAWSIARQSNMAHHMVRVAGFITYVRYISSKSKREYVDKAIDFCQKEDFPGLLSKLLLCRGLIASKDGEDERALSLFRETIETSKNIRENDMRLARDYPFAISFYSPRRFIQDCFEHIGDIYRRNGKWPQALKEYKRVYEYKEAEKNIAGMSGLLNVIAETQLTAGFIQDADRSFEQSWTIAEQLDSRVLKAMVLSTGITIALEQEDDDKARRRLILFENLIHDWSTRWTWHKKQMMRGILSMRDKATKEASDFLTVGLKAAEEEEGFGLIVQYSLHLADLNLQSSDLDQALRYANNALRIARTHDLWDLGEAYMTAARVKVRMNMVNEAEELIEKAFEYFQNKKLSHKAALAQEFRLQIRNP